MPEESDRLPIGELARRTGLATSALRYYERIGLLPRAERAGGRRHYPASVHDRVAMIRVFQDAGFTLAEIRRMLVAITRGRSSWTPLAERKIEELEARIAEAQRAKTLLERGLACPHRDILACPNFRAGVRARRASPAVGEARGASASDSGRTRRRRGRSGRRPS